MRPDRTTRSTAGATRADAGGLLEASRPSSPNETVSTKPGGHFTPGRQTDGLAGAMDRLRVHPAKPVPEEDDRAQDIASNDLDAARSEELAVMDGEA